MTLRTLLTAFVVLVAPLVAHAQIIVHGGLARDRAATPGQTYEEVVQVHNTSDEAQQVKLYQTDYQFAADGSNSYGPAGTSDRSNADWVTFAPPLLTVPPGETVPVTITVRVPGDASQGSHWSMLMIESIPRGSAESTLDSNDGFQFGIVERIRYGVQLATHLGSPVTDVDVVTAEVRATEEGGRVLAIDVANTGARMLDGPVYLDVFDADGTARGRLEGSSARLYPGTSFRHRVDLSSLPHGAYEALLVIDGGEAGVFGKQYSLDL